jgi:hypothetical protein
MSHSPIPSRLLAGLLAAASVADVAAQVTGPDVTRHQSAIDTIVATISRQRIESTIRKLVSFQTRHTMSTTTSNTVGIGAARRWITSELQRCGAGTRLQVTLDSYVAPVAGTISRPTEIVNVIATLPGMQPGSVGRMYVISGHYDSRNSNIMDATGAAPGANDDASGTAAVMEMACVMARQQFDATIVFMAVAGEEQSLLGAHHWAAQARQNNLNIAAMFTNDIIGSSRAEDGRVDNMQVRLFAESFPPRQLNSANLALLSTGGENDSISRQLARHVKEQGERYVPNFKVSVIQRRDRYGRGGDHIAFLDRGYAAVRFTEPNEDYAHQHQNLRTENGKVYGDLIEFVDFEYIARVARVNAAALASLALGPGAPQQVRVLTDRPENQSRFVWQPNAEPDLAGYRIVWRETTAPQWQGSLFVGNVTAATVNRSKDNYFFGVQAVDTNGNVSVATYPLP